MMDMYIVFEYILCRHAVVGYGDNIMISVSVILMFLALYQAKKNPGIINHGETKLQLFKSFGMNSAAGPEHEHNMQSLNQLSDISINSSEALKNSDEIILQVMSEGMLSL